MLPRLLFVLTLALLATVAVQEHAVCNWQPHRGSPELWGYTKFCRSMRGNIEDDKCSYYCLGGDIGEESTEVATWGQLRDWLVNIATPCGGDGFGFDEEGDCIAPIWAACWGNSLLGDCYYLYSSDDCEWPNYHNASEIPTYISIWYRLGGQPLERAAVSKRGKAGQRAARLGQRKRLSSADHVKFSTYFRAPMPPA